MRREQREAVRQLGSCIHLCAQQSHKGCWSINKITCCKSGLDPEACQKDVMIRWYDVDLLRKILWS